LGFIQNCITVREFKTTLHWNEKKWASIVRYPLREKMEDLITHLDLIYIHPINGKFTWNNRREGLGHIVARLDEFLIHSHFLENPGTIVSHILPWESSDHHPIYLFFSKEENMDLIPCRFNPLLMDDRSSFPWSFVLRVNIFWAPLSLLGNKI